MKVKEASSIWRPHPSHTQQPPPAQLLQRGRSVQSFFTLGRGRLPNPTHPPLRVLIKGRSGGCPQRRLRAGEVFQMLGAFHQVSAASPPPSTSTHIQSLLKGGLFALHPLRSLAAPGKHSPLALKGKVSF